MITEKEILELGFNLVKKYKLIPTYQFKGYFDLPFYSGGRTSNIYLQVKPERNAIRIVEEEYNSYEGINSEILYCGFCHTIDELKDLLFNKLFGGDGQTVEDIKKQFNNETI